jgi:predicted RND superfamily exporter protein
VPQPPKGRGLRAAASRALVKRTLSQQREQLEKSRLLVDDGREEIWRVSVRIRATGDQQFAPFLDDARRSVEDLLKGLKTRGATGVYATYTGAMPAAVRIQSELWVGLRESLWIALILIGVVMVAALRSVASGLLVMLPNVFPLIAIFGLMGWTRMPLDIGAMMTGSIALGIAVDDTCHFLIWFGRGRRNGEGRRSAILTSYRRCGTAMIFTSVICGCSMLVYLASGFVPAARFGGLMFTLIFAAVLGDLVLLPALLLVRARGRD